MRLAVWQSRVKNLYESSSGRNLLKRCTKIQTSMPGMQDSGFRVGYTSAASGSKWVKRFNAEGIASLEDKLRSGKPLIHIEKVRSQLVDLAPQKPRTLDLPFELWTLTRLQIEYEKRYGLRLDTSTIWKWPQAEGLDCKRHQSWFQDADKHDPEFVEKRGGHHPSLCEATATYSSYLP